MTKRINLMVALLMVLAPCACAPTKGPVVTSKPSPPPPSSQPAPESIISAKLRFIDCQPTKAMVVVDDEERGTVEELATKGGLDVSLGVHRIIVKHTGYESYRVELSVDKDGERISIQLKPKRRRR